MCSLTLKIQYLPKPTETFTPKFVILMTFYARLTKDIQKTMSNPEPDLKSRFRGYYPVVIDVETAGFNAKTDALLEIAASLLTMDSQGQLCVLETLHFPIHPFEGANLEESALKFTGIDPYNPLRGAIHEKDAFSTLFQRIAEQQKAHHCQRSIIVGHNAHFDLQFVFAAAERIKAKRNPFHPFSCFDTATLAGLAYGQTVLAKACALAGIEFDGKQAHSALYDTQKTAALFCTVVNKWQSLGGWPMAALTPKDSSS